MKTMEKMKVTYWTGRCKIIIMTRLSLVPRRKQMPVVSSLPISMMMMLMIIAMT